MRRALLCIPGLFPARSDPLAGPGFPGPALHRLLARSLKSARACATPEALLCSLFGVTPTPDLPVGALTLLGDGGDPGASQWLRADPVHLRAEQGALILVSTRHQQVSNQEAQALTAELNRHFAADGLQFSARHPHRWHVRLPQPMDLVTRPPSEADGCSIDPLLPVGADAMTVHRWANEAQMLLHAHPVNEAREARGEPPINSLWWWGAGGLPAPAGCAHAAGWGDDPLLGGLCKWSGTPIRSPPASGVDWLRQAGDGSHVVVLSSPPDVLEQAWFAPLLAALRRRELRELTLLALHAGRALSFALGASDLWKFWRRGTDLMAAAHA
jgi:hypothetical protein